MRKQEVILCESKQPRVSIHVTASLDKDGGLTLSGYDTGEAVEAFWGDDDYEYCLRISPADTEKLFELICADNPESDPLDVLQEKFHGTGAFNDIREFCAQHGIEARFDSYT